MSEFEIKSYLNLLEKERDALVKVDGYLSENFPKSGAAIEQAVDLIEESFDLVEDASNHFSEILVEVVNLKQSNEQQNPHKEEVPSDEIWKKAILKLALELEIGLPELEFGDDKVKVADALDIGAEMGISHQVDARRKQQKQINKAQSTNDKTGFGYR